MSINDVSPAGVALKLADAVTEAHHEFRSQSDHIRYGLEWVLSGFYQVMAVVLLAFPFQLHKEALVCLITGALLRMASGGVHFASYWWCFAVGTVQILFSSFLAAAFEQQGLHIPLVPTFVILAAGLILTAVFAPRLYKTKLLFSHTRLLVFKGVSVALYTLLSILMLSIITDPSLQFVIGMALFYQVFSLTPFGDKTIQFFNSLSTNPAERRRVS
ncbi:accessory gene regulator B family protein [Halobacillus sp. Marseille-Q1614]|uniref:accessory gene regulator B family protein n=1 Tax=Halobacillus sp. Marseille-Q1614 TaxID=2709134 RepID=UPI00156FDD76|nr:accessory gene regulator B family protein [Halobacillus sp. Marseille-Q1614]